MAGGVVIVAGFGSRRAATADALGAALLAAAACLPSLRTGIALGVTRLAAPSERRVPVEELARMLGLRVVLLGDGDLGPVETPTRSPVCLGRRGIGSMAEACALAGAGAGAHLLVSRRISACRGATCALAVDASTYLQLARVAPDFVKECPL